MSSPDFPTTKPERGRILSGVKNVVAVASGKGGVGKSTVAANLAVALSQLGGRCGLLDLDVYGPSIPLMFGVWENPRPSEKGIPPLEAHGLKLMSVGFLSERGTSITWRGPLVTKLVHQFVKDVDWGELDFLVLDLPPGTGDVQLTLSQSVPLSGGLIVTTPQQLALEDVGRGTDMFQKVDIPVLGVVENMSGFTCPDCGKTHEIFSKGGGLKEAESLGVPFLGSIPILPELVSSGDTGKPGALSKGSQAHKVYEKLAKDLILRLEELESQKNP